MHLDLVRSLYWSVAIFLALFAVVPALVTKQTSAVRPFGFAIRTGAAALYLLAAAWFVGRFFFPGLAEVHGHTAPNMALMVLVATLYLAVGNFIERCD